MTNFPKAALAVDIRELHIETKDIHRGHFEIRNTGGGVLNGHVLSRCPGLTFGTVHFEGNKQTVHYTFDGALAGLATGQTIEGYAYVTSNGGEVEIPVTAKLAKMSITTGDGAFIANLEDFYAYAQTHPAQARRLFVDGEFYMLLLALGYEYMEVYESLHKDSNRERALDNFFILSGLKGKTTLDIPGDRVLEYAQKPGDKDILHGSITVTKSDPGYIDAPITIAQDAPWLNCYASRLIHSDFDEALEGTIHFSINPSLIEGAYARTILTVGEGAGHNIELIYRRLPLISVRLSRTNLKYEDRGALEVVNNTGDNVRVEVFCQDSYIRFSAKNYLVGAIGEIPFDVKLSAFLSAQMLFRKVPYMTTKVEVKATHPGGVYKTQIPLVVGQW